MPKRSFGRRKILVEEAFILGLEDSSYLGLPVGFADLHHGSVGRIEISHVDVLVICVKLGAFILFLDQITRSGRLCAATFADVKHYMLSYKETALLNVSTVKNIIDYEPVCTCF